MESRIEKLMDRIYSWNQHINSLDQNILDLKKQKDDCEKYVEEAKAELLNLLTEQNQKEFKCNNLIAAVCEKENVGYTDETAVLNYLKNNGYVKYVRTKITESIDKNPLKKALKEDLELSNALSEMTTKSITRYIVVTDDENYNKMLEHINEGK